MVVFVLYKKVFILIQRLGHENSTCYQLGSSYEASRDKFYRPSFGTVVKLTTQCYFTCQLSTAVISGDSRCRLSGNIKHS